MAARGSTGSLHALRKYADQRAAQLTSGACVPTDLAAIAGQLDVVQIVARPIVCTAGLGRVGKGYEVVVNTEARGNDLEPNRPRRTQDGWSGLGHSMRFWVAHELAHILCLEAEGKCQYRLNSDQAETECNRLAHVILLPQSRLGMCFSEHGFSASRLSALSATAEVSLVALVNGLSHRHLPDPGDVWGGYVLTARSEESGPPTIESCYVYGALSEGLFQRKNGTWIGASMAGFPLGANVDECIERMRTAASGEEHHHVGGYGVTVQYDVAGRSYRQWLLCARLMPA